MAKEYERMKPRLLLCLAALTTLLVSTGPAQTDDLPTITDEMRKDDPRLKTPVSLSYAQIYLGDLVERLSERTGVTIAAGQSDGSREVQICVNCSNVSLGDLMDGLWSLVSYRGALWKWERTGKPGDYHYTLRQPFSAGRFKERMRAWEQERFEMMLRKLIAAVDESDDAKSAVLQELYYVPELGPIRDSAVIPMDILWAQVRMLKESFAPAELTSFIRGGGPPGGVSVSIGSLSAQSRAFLDREREFMRQNSNPPDPPPVSPTIKIVLQKRIRFPQVAVIYQAVRSGPVNIGGAILAVGLKQHLLALWQHDRDTLDNPLAHVPIGSGTTAKTGTAILESAEPSQSMTRRLAANLFEIAAGVPTNLLARLSDNEPLWLVNSPRGLTIEDYWKSMYGRPLIQKWRNGIHLVSSSEWPLLDGAAPLDFVNRLRRDAKAGMSLPLDDLAEAALMLTDAQILDLKWEFPVMAMVVERRDMLGMLKRFPELARQAQTVEGLPLTPRTIETLRQLPPLRFVTRLRREEGEVLRIHVKDRHSPENTASELVFEWFGPDGKLRGLLTFENTPQPKGMLR